MASVRFRPEKNYYEIRKYVTDPKTRRAINFIETLPADASQLQIAKLCDRLDKQAAAIKAGSNKIPDTVQRSFNEWRRWIQNKPVGRKRKILSERTQAYYRTVLERFIRSLPRATRKITQLIPAHVEAFNNRLLDEGLKCRTVNANLTAIKSFARWLSDLYGVENFAAEVPLYSEENPDHRFFTDEEYTAIMAAGSALFRQRFGFISHTGVRATEFVTLRWADVNEHTATLRVTGKGGKIRHIPLNRACMAILAEIKCQTPQFGTNNRIFVSKSNSHGNLGGPIGRRVLNLQCEPIAERLNIRKFGPHAFRHWFATALLVKGVPVKHVSRLMGHGSVRTTETIYEHILPGHLKGVTDCLCD